MPNADLVTLEREGPIATLTLNDPDRRNVMSRDMGEVFRSHVKALVAEREVRAVIVTGAGKAFAAGGDFGMLEQLAARGTEGGEANRLAEEMHSFYSLYLSVRELRVPSIAAINGPAIGAGLCFALGCDIRIASSSARLALNFASLGLHPGMGGTWSLPRLVGPARAAELLFSGRVIDPDEAVRIGLVNRAVAPEEVLPQARALAETDRRGRPHRDPRHQARAGGQPELHPRAPARDRGLRAGALLRDPGHPDGTGGRSGAARDPGRRLRRRLSGLPREPGEGFASAQLVRNPSPSRSHPAGGRAARALCLGVGPGHQENDPDVPDRQPDVVIHQRTRHAGTPRSRSRSTPALSNFRADT